MMGRTHALTGWCAGLAAAPMLRLTDLDQMIPFAAVVSGFALLPDLDHPNARASKLFGPITGVLSRVLRRISAAVYQLTKGPRDEKVTGKHRHLSHTVLFAAGLGTLTAMGTTAGGPYAVAGVLLLGLVLAANALGPWPLIAALVATGGSLIIAGPPDLDGLNPLHQLGELSGWLGIAVALGCVVHCIGDALTESGCPFLWPLPIRGETWYELRPPKVLRFRTGKSGERLVVFPVFAVIAVLLIPGMPATISETTTAVVSAVISER